jgi:hypothetical protein
MSGPETRSSFVRLLSAWLQPYISNCQNGNDVSNFCFLKFLIDYCFSSGYLGSSLGGVKVAYGKNDSIVLASARAWLMVYHLQFYPHNASFLSGLWEKVSFEICERLISVV